MKFIGAVLKILAALAAIAGIVYVIATYGDKIVCWAKNLLGLCDCDCECLIDEEESCDPICLDEEETAAPEADETVSE